MTAAINIQCQPSPLMFGTAGPLVVVQIDEAGRVQSDEAGNVLMPDPEVVTVQGDENNHSLTDENGALNRTEPGPGP
jgi:hypothetical protein